jgi:hypothetical protein
MHCGFCDVGLTASAKAASPTGGLLRILYCLVFVDCAVALGNCLVNCRRIKVEEITLTVLQVTRQTKRERGALQKTMN